MWWGCTTSQPGGAWEKKAVDPSVNESLLPAILSYPTVLITLSRKPPLLTTLLSSCKAQYFSFTDSLLLISLPLCGKNSSFSSFQPDQKSNYIYLLGDRCFLQITCWRTLRLKREKRKRRRRKYSSFYCIFFLFLSLPLLTHSIKWTECCDLLSLSPTGCSSYLKKKKQTWKNKYECIHMHVYMRLKRKKRKNERLQMQETPSILPTTRTKLDLSESQQQRQNSRRGTKPHHLLWESKLHSGLWWRCLSGVTALG